MNRIFTRRRRTVLAVFSSCLLGIVAFVCWEETDDLVIITLPPYQELLGLKNCFGSDYNLQIVIDKKKRVVVSALSG